MRIVLVTCALFAAACGGSDARPATDPSTQSASMNAPGSSTTPPSVGYDSTTAGQTTTNNPSLQGGATTNPTGTPSSSDTSSAPTIMPASAQGRSTSDVGAGTPSGGTGMAASANDPGTGDATPNADNTKLNARDRHNTLTPMKQGNSKDEIAITAAIRRGVMSDKSLSFTAKNVKIITVGTKVTLRGPVNSDAEKAAIDARARQASGVTDVDDQLEVKK